jgi:hypothetical protein
MKNTAEMLGGKPIAVSSQPISDVSVVNPLAAFYEIYRRGEVLFFYSVSDTKLFSTSFQIMAAIHSVIICSTIFYVSN